MDPKFYGNLLFKGIAAEELEQLDLVIEECSFGANQVVFREGEEGQCLFLVAEGAVRIAKEGRGGKQETLVIKEPGSFFGEMALLDGHNRSASATAEKPTVLGRVDRDGLDRFLEHSPGAARHFMRVLMKQLRTANSKFIRDLIDNERLSLIGSMMTSIVHDIRNPIATISMVGDYLVNRNDSTLKELGKLTETAVIQMQSMIQELLDYSRGASKAVLEKTTVAEIVDNLDEQILDRLTRRGASVFRDIGYAGEIHVDRGRFLRLLLNIVKNAEEAIPQDGSLTLRTRLDGNFVKFEVQDNGCGIPPEILPKIFEPFVTHGKTKGTGLGMAIAKSMVEAHNGQIWLDSRQGEGTTCHISLPKSPSIQ